MKINAALVFAMALQACALVWFLSQQNSKIEEIYKFYQQESEKSVVENQVKMKLDLENVIALVNDMNKDLKKLKNKDQVIIKQNNKIEKQHKQIFQLFNDNINPNTNSNSSGGYSYGD